MKILHCADIHLGSKIESKFPKEISSIRKRELMNTFSRMVDYAKSEDIKIILLSGDVFDKDKPSLKEKEYFYKIIKSNPEIDFLYLNGNHDKEGSFIEKDISNLKVFSKETITTYQYDNISISGIEITPSNSNVFYSRINLNEDNINIFMLHGEISSSSGMDKIKLESLKNKNIDYLALGHIHKRDEGKIDERGIYVYPGNLEPRGFDECGEKGFVVLDITDKISHTFIPFSKRTIHEVIVDVTGVQSSFDILMKAKEKVKAIPYQDILRIRLVGELSLNVEVDEREIEVSLSSYFFVNVKNETTSSLDPSKYDNDKSLIGEFIRGVYENNTYSDEEKQKIVAMGLRVISGKEIE